MNDLELSVAPQTVGRLETVEAARAEVERLRAGFVNTLVRDVRLPLAGVLGLLDLFQSKLAAREPFDAEDRQLLAVAVEQGARVRHVVDDLLELSQQHERPLALRVEPTDAAELIASAVETVRAEAALRGVEIKTQIEREIPALVVDPKQARRALRHLICVALEATRDGGAITINAHGLTGTRVGEAGRSLALLSVADAGDGIPAEELPFVFDSFWHATDPRSRSAARGISLAIAKRVAAAHGGSVSVRSQVGVGSVYSLVLPARAEPRRREDGSARVLVVEDSPDLCLLVGKLVERMGYEVLLAPDVPRALELLEQNEIDLLLTDWAMPGMNGGDLISKMKSDSRWQSIPTVVLTGHDLERQSARDAGCDRFLVKPAVRDELRDAISELLQATVN
ncbi:MAG TPA: hybrid sensor histidine kinase/response regulator [Pyrinomonadaceae bacterium]|jgi:CheY-like chemotaxis protein/nitrogen-specific signal transduction histidine kinase